MNFDYIIGNPPYQDETIGDNKGFAPPVYDKFIDGAYQIGDKVELIHPARFLFNAGSTPKQWNKKMLNDPHLKVLSYEPDASKIFPNTDIKGGVAITYHDKTIDFGAIEIFISNPLLNDIVKKVEKKSSSSLDSIMYNQSKFNLDNLYNDYSDLKNVIGSAGKDKRFRNNIFSKVHCFTEKSVNDDDLEVFGLINNKRVWRYIPRKYVDFKDSNVFFWKVIMAISNGNGYFGETLATPLVLKPSQTYTQSFIGLGAFETEVEASSALKYVKTKFARALLGVLKVTQDNPSSVWKYVPLQDFTSSSDIDWSKSIHDIDLQLYAKYGLDAAETAFIEKMVKEME